MCGPQFECSDSPDSRPKREVTITVRDAQGGEGIRHLEIASRLSADELAADLVWIVQDRSGSDYVRLIDAAR